MPMKNVPIAMTIAGSDSGGGAGIQADIKVMSALGVFGTSALTALTAQSTTAVDGVYPVPIDFIEQQIQTVWQDMDISAVKIGMLGSSQATKSVAQTLQACGAKNIVLDTVMVAKSGDRLLQSDAVDSLIKNVVPMADIITPNIPEACDLLGIDTINTIDDMHTVAEALLQQGCKSVLIKGGHMLGDVCTDVYMDKYHSFCVKNQRIKTVNTHGTGCSLSSAIASFLAHGQDMPDAVKNAISYVSNAVKYADDLGHNGIGKGNGPIYHFYDTWV